MIILPVTHEGRICREAFRWVMPLTKCTHLFWKRCFLNYVSGTKWNMLWSDFPNKYFQIDFKATRTLCMISDTKLWHMMHVKWPCLSPKLSQEPRMFLLRALGFHQTVRKTLIRIIQFPYFLWNNQPIKDKTWGS